MQWVYTGREEVVTQKVLYPSSRLSPACMSGALRDSFGEVLTCEKKHDNASNSYTVAVIKKSIPDNKNNHK